MAQKVTDESFARGKYPWPDWTDGSQWKIVKGEDYDINTDSMQISLHGRAKTEGMTVFTKRFRNREPDHHGVFRDNEGLVFQFNQPHE